MARLADPDLAQRRRQQILDAAELCFRRRGFHQATMQEICAEARISPGALYRYFGSKADIIAAIAEEKHGETDDQFEEALAKSGILEAFDVMLQRFMLKVTDEDFAALFCDIAGEAARDPELAKRLSEIDEKSHARFARAIADAQTRGEVDARIDARDAAEALAGAMLGLGLHVALRRDGSPEDALRQLRTLAERLLASPA
ncbi:MAG: TetR/AcrR family transcriptional regulator [Hyphomonadaceae bacterium]